MSLICPFCGYDNKNFMENCENCQSSLQILKKKKNPPILYIRESFFLRIISIISIVLLIAGIVFGLVPVFQLIKKNTVSAVPAAIFGMGLIITSIILMCGSLISQIVLDEELRKDQFEKQRFISSFRLLLLTVKDDLSRIILILAIIFGVLGVIFGIKPLNANMGSDHNKYPSSIVLSVGLIIISVQLFITSWILRIYLDTPKIKSIEQKNILENKVHSNSL